jgi:hypothetical protein
MRVCDEPTRDLKQSKCWCKVDTVECDMCILEKAKLCTKMEMTHEPATKQNFSKCKKKKLKKTCERLNTLLGEHVFFPKAKHLNTVNICPLNVHYPIWIIKDDRA